MPRDKHPRTQARWQGEEQFSGEVMELLQMAVRSVTVLEMESETESPHKRVVLAFTPRTNGMELTHLTMEELFLFKTIVLNAIARAEPIVALRDQEALEAFQRGDIRHRRLWRARPRYIDFSNAGENKDAVQPDTEGVPPDPGGSGDEPEHGSGLQSRP